MHILNFFYIYKMNKNKHLYSLDSNKRKKTNDLCK